MGEQLTPGRRRFQTHESPRAHALNGLPLATFWQRLLGYFVDLLLAVLVWFPLEFLVRRYLLHEDNINMV
jgi:hypothetical protein